MSGVEQPYLRMIFSTLGGMGLEDELINLS